MKYSKTVLILAGIGALVIACGALWIFGNANSRYGIQSQPILPNGIPIQSFSSGTSSSVATSSLENSSINIAGAYAALFQSIKATVPAFSPIGSGQTDIDIYRLYAQDIAVAQQISSSTATIDVATVDLNYDNKPEVLVYENLPGFCGTGGCTLDVYQQALDGWHKTFSTLSQSENIGISTVLTGTYADLYISQHASSSPDSAIIKYVWNGTTYGSAGMVAQWNGSSFTLTQ